MITIALEGMRFHAHVGWYEEEKILGNEIVVDLYLNVHTNLSDSETLEQIVNYETVFETVNKVLSEKTNLLEKVCRKIISRVALLSSDIESIEVRVSKLNPPVEGKVDRVFVEEEWTKEK